MDVLIIVISGHASLYVKEEDIDKPFVQRTLFPGDAIGDGPIAFDMKHSQRFSLRSETDCDFVYIDKEKFK